MIPNRHYDLAIVGAGVIGLTLAYLAQRRGLTVVVLERTDRSVGASIRNFGHIGITTQDGEGLGHAEAGRSHWLELAREAGFWLAEAGTLLVARSEAERELLGEFAALRDGAVKLLSPSEVEPLASIRDPRLVGAAHCVNDLRISSIEAIPAIAAHLASVGVQFHFSTNVTGAVDGVVQTSRGDLSASNTVFATGHDTDMLFPEEHEAAQVQRCLLHMLEVDAPARSRFDPVILTGTGVLRYGGLAQCDAAQQIMQDMRSERPDLLAAAVNIKMSQRPNGRLVIGDTHAYAHTHEPFREEALDDLLLAEFEALLGSKLTVRRRWEGVYAASQTHDFVVREPRAGVYLAAVTNGTGMSTGMGFAESVLNRFA
jgi:FAD dependent oxidoreductase TIGR03364